MNLRWRRTAAIAAAVLTGALLAPTVGSAPASAYCAGPGWPATLSVYQNGVLLAYERATETCDGNGVYRGAVTDVAGDGLSTTLRIRDGSYFGVYRIEDGTFRYSFYDQNGDSSSYLQLITGSSSTPWVANAGY